MRHLNYYQSYVGYFWQWEDNLTVLAIPNGNTIAYREFIIDVINKIALQGLPPFGSLLLAIVATNPNFSESIESIKRTLFIKEANKGDNFSNLEQDHALVDAALPFLELLSRLPDHYKKGKNRILLLQAIFENCHNILSVDKSIKLKDEFSDNNQGALKTIDKKEKLEKNLLFIDFKTIALLGNKFKTVEDLLAKIASLPNIDESKIDLEAIAGNTQPSEDFLEQLIENNKSFYVASLVKRIWGGLNIPLNNSLPSYQPLGGVSDLTNKGDFDKLLISEFANDDIIFMSRLANNEALFIQREIPPSNNDLERIILIDVSLKNWGTPKVISFAVMLAIAKHPKTKIDCTVYAIGNSYYPIAIDNIDGIINGIQLLDGSLHAANGLEKFFKDQHERKNREVFLLAEPSSLKHEVMLRTIHEYHNYIHYFIYTDSEGNIDIYKRQNNAKKHIQHILLPLKELWNSAKKAKVENITRNSKENKCPLLIRNSTNIKKVLSTPNGDIYQIRANKTLVRFGDRTLKQFEKGWEIITEELPFTYGDFEIGINSNNELILLLYNPNTKEIFLFNVFNQESKIVSFPQWKSAAGNSFVFHQQQFFYKCFNQYWRISLDGQVNLDNHINNSIFIDRENELKNLNTRFSYAQPVFININEVFINEVQNLVFNIHELHLNVGNHIKIDKMRREASKISVATKIADREFKFNDGSTIEINKNGILILNSSNATIPTIYLPSSLDSSLAIATNAEFAGNEYYYKEIQFDINLTNAGTKRLSIVKLLKDSFSEMGLSQAKDLVDFAPSQIAKSISKSKTFQIKSNLEAEGATVEITASQNAQQTAELSKISTSLFFQKHMIPYINTILAYGTKD